MSVGASVLSPFLSRKHTNISRSPSRICQKHSPWPEVWARDYPEAVQENRIEFSDLDFFTQVPVKGKDVYFLRAIIHNWSDREAALILGNLRQALGPHSRILIHDYVLRGLGRKQAEAEAASLGTVVAPEPLLPNFGVGNISMYQADLTMWIVYNAKERMLRNLLELSTAAGLKLEKVWDLVDFSVLEFSVA